MARWTSQQVRAAAPDESSLKAAGKLAVPGPWSDTGATELLVWGKCQGSGKTPYQVSVDLVGPAYRCSCPSRKFPCKHALALLMLWSSGAIDSSAEAAGFAQDWADERVTRQAKQAARAETRAATPVDPAAAERRLESRLALMDAGMDDFALWLHDLGRQGLAAARQQPYAWWDATAARLVDAQLPGLAEQVRSMGSAVHRRADWADHLLGTAGRWWVATRAWSARETLDPNDLADLRVALGWAFPTAEVRQGEDVRGEWLVLGAHRTEDGRIQQQRTWLWGGPVGEIVQLLDFSADPSTMAAPQLAGTVLEASVARYPGSAPARVLFREDPVHSAKHVAPPPGVDVSGALAAVADRLATAPWTDRVPVMLGPVHLAPTDGPGLIDADDHWLPLVPEAPVWRIQALTGGGPTILFGEVDEGHFRPLSIVQDQGLVAL